MTTHKLSTSSFIMLTITLATVTMTFVACGGESGNRTRLKKGSSDKAIEKTGIADIKAEVVCARANSSINRDNKSNNRRSKNNNEGKKLLDVQALIAKINKEGLIVRHYTSDIKLTKSDISASNFGKDQGDDNYDLNANFLQDIGDKYLYANSDLSDNFFREDQSLSTVSGNDMALIEQSGCDELNFRVLSSVDGVRKTINYKYSIDEKLSTGGSLVLEATGDHFKGAQLIHIKRNSLTQLSFTLLIPGERFKACDTNKTSEYNLRVATTLEFGTRLNPSVNTSRNLLKTLQAGEVKLSKEITGELEKNASTGSLEISPESYEAAINEAAKGIQSKLCK